MTAFPPNSSQESVQIVTASTPQELRQIMTEQMSHLAAQTQRDQVTSLRIFFQGQVLYGLNPKITLEAIAKGDWEYEAS